MIHARKIRALCLGIVIWANLGLILQADEFLLADAKAWPGRLLVAQDTAARVYTNRPNTLPEGAVPRVQSVATLPDGRVIFCSGLDRFLMESTPTGERTFHHGGYLARQIRADVDGQVYWSGLETPRDGAPLPDGFIYAWNPANDESRTVLTFSQNDVGHDWWGAFDVRDGRVFVATLHEHSKIYDVTSSVGRLIATLPMSVTAIRFAPDGSLYACDGQGILYHFPDLNDTNRQEVVVKLTTPFVDFAKINARR